MRIEYVFPVRSAVSGPNGFEIDGFGASGFIAPVGEPPFLLALNVMHCWIREEGDDEGTTCTFCYQVVGPDGEQKPVWTTAVQEPITQKREINPERLYFHGKVEILFTGDGQYDVQWGDTPDEGATIVRRFLMPVVLVQLPAL